MTEEKVVDIPKASWTIVLPVGALTLLGALMLSVSNEAAVALKLGEQHGESILLMREELQLLRKATENRYTTYDAERDLGYIQRDIREIKDAIKENHTGR
ncbi:MAG: hypothetical protein JRE23_15490 [Deltaproteobacteria bacterium]|nr:hypothetical protein [Deltaproteobacteria bacterium]